MRAAKEEVPSRNKKVVNLVLAVKELHGLSSQQLGKLIKDSENNIIRRTTENGSLVQIDVEKLARYLPMHLIARVISVERDEASFRYLLCGFQLLYSLCDQASRHPTLEQAVFYLLGLSPHQSTALIDLGLQLKEYALSESGVLSDTAFYKGQIVLLDDVKVSEQLIDLVFYMLIVLDGFQQELLASSHTALLHSALVTCSLYLLRVCISSQWPELVQVLLAHPKVEIFMSVAFAAVRINIQFLRIKLSDQCVSSCTNSSAAEETLNHLSRHCEASLQFLQSLCQQKLFRELVVKNKELCGKGGVLLLAQDILKLHILPSFKESSLMSAISRLKAKVLSILLHLCEVESTSYLDDIASTHESLCLAKSVALEVVALLKTMFGGDLRELSARPNKTYPRGLLQLNAMRFVDILSDDSNFRSHITVYFTEVVCSIFYVSHGEFLSSWCSSELPILEEDATLEYDPLAAAGWVLDLFSSADVVIARNSEPTFNLSHVPRASYAHQRTSLMVKAIANLHFHVPEICKEEKDIFLNRFLNIVKTKFIHSSDILTFKSGAEKASIICRNLRSLLSHAESLIPEYLNEDDSQLLRVFISQIGPLISPRVAKVQDNKFEESTSWGRLSKLHISEQHQGAHNIGGCSSPIPRNSSPDNYSKSGDLKGDMSESSDVEEVNQFDVEEVNQFDAKENYGVKNFNIAGVGFGEVQEDDKAEKIQCKEKQQRKRKRTIMNDKQVSMIEKALIDEPHMQRKKASIHAWANKLIRHGSEVTASQLKNWLNNRKARLARAAAKDVCGPSDNKQCSSGVGDHYDSPERPVEGHIVRILDEQGEEIGRGYVYQSKGTWSGKNLEESGTCVVDITVLEMDKWAGVPYPSEATGNSFAQAEKLFGRKRVWVLDCQQPSAPPQAISSGGMGRMILLKDVVPAAENNIKIQFILLDNISSIDLRIWDCGLSINCDCCCSLCSGKSFSGSSPSYTQEPCSGS